MKQRLILNKKYGALVSHVNAFVKLHNLEECGQGY